MRISDWSSDVCSSDLPGQFTLGLGLVQTDEAGHPAIAEPQPVQLVEQTRPGRVREAAHADRPQVRITELRRHATRQRRIGQPRSEEHTSELQSLMRISYAVFCLKKKKTTTHKQKIVHIKKHLPHQ